MTNDFLTVTEAASIARAPISTVRHWMHTGRLKSYKPGRSRLIKRVDLMAFIEATASTVV